MTRYLRLSHLMGIVAILVTASMPLDVSASHTRQLTVQEVKAALDKAPSLREKGFILVDVRTPEEHDTGAIPGTDLNIEYREIAQRHR